MRNVSADPQKQIPTETNRVLAEVQKPPARSRQHANYVRGQLKPDDQVGLQQRRDQIRDCSEGFRVRKQPCPPAMVARQSLSVSRRQEAPRRAVLYQAETIHLMPELGRVFGHKRPEPRADRLLRVGQAEHHAAKHIVSCYDSPLRSGPYCPP